MLKRFPALGLSALIAAWVAANILAGPSQVLYEKQSAYNTIVVTEDEQGLRTLRFERNGARQSVVKVGDPDHLELPYVRGVLVSLALVENPRRILVIGLGGGTIPTFLHRHYPASTIDAVDIDPEVVAVARKYFDFRDDDRLRGHVADGRRFIEECRDPYDLIILDAFSSDSIPYHLATREFLQATRRALTTNGVVAGNIWTRPSNALYDSMVRTYLDVFAGLYLVDVPGSGNQILLALPRTERVGSNELAGRAAELTRAKHLPFDLGEWVRREFRPAPSNGVGRVLTDAGREPPAPSRP